MAAALVSGLLAMPLLVAATATPASATVVATETITDARHYVTYLPGAPRAFRGLTSGPGGNLWFLGHDAGINSGLVGKLDPVSHGIQTWAVPGTEYRAPTNITVAGDGTLWFTYFQSSVVSRFDPVTQAFTTYPTSSATQDIATGPDGSVWFTEPQPPSVFFPSGNYIGHITLAGVLTEYPILTPVPSTAPAANSIEDGITAGPDGNMWFNEKYQNKIGRITPSGVVTEFVVPTPDALTNDIASADGFLWFTESAVNKIGRLDPATGTFAEFFTGTGPEASPRLIVAGPDGHPWFSEGSDTSSPGYLARMNAAGTITQAVLIGGPDARSVDDQGATVTGGQPPDFLAVGPDGNLWWTLTGINAPRAGLVRLVPPRQPPAPPIVRGMSPQTGTAAGSTRVVITGTGLTGASVRLNGVETTSTTDSDTRLTLITPPRPAGTIVTVSVLAPGGAAAVTAGTFTYTAPRAPSGLLFTPSSAPAQGGSVVTISGSDLEGATFDFGGIAVAATRGPSGGYDVTVPAATATPTVTVTASTPYGTTTAAFTYTTASSRLGGPPELVSLDPDAGPPSGGGVNIYGHNFGPDGFHDAVAAVRFDTTDGHPYYQTYYVQSANDPNDPTLSVVGVAVPPHAPGTVRVTVTTEAGVSNALPYTFTDVARPEVTAISPDTGPEAGGTATTITGTGFQAGATPVRVFFGGAAATSVNVTSDTTLDVITPAGTGFAPVTVRTEGGTSAFPYGAPQYGVRFAYVSSQAPVITSLSPSSGSPDGGGGYIYGSHFVGATSVTLGDLGSTTFEVVSDTKIGFATPPAPAGTTFQVRVTTPAGTSALTPAGTFTYLGPPTLTGFAPGSPTSGSTAGGTHVTLLGQNFLNTTGVSFGNYNATVFVVSPDGTSIDVTTPPATQGTGPANIQVFTPSGAAYTVDTPNGPAYLNFTYTDPAYPVFQDFRFYPPPPNGGRVGVAYLDANGNTYTIHATGDPAPTFSVGSGGLPPGLTLNPTTGALTGTPTTAGTYTFTFRATNGVSPDAVTPQFQIIIAPEAPRTPTFTASSPPSAATAGAAYGPYTFVATGNPGPITYDVINGSLPAGLSLNANTGVLSGTPTTTGTYSFAVRATNGVGSGVSGTITITVAPAPPAPPVLTASSPATVGSVGSTFGPYTFTASGNPAPTFAVASGALPTGMSLGSTGVLSGTPTASGAFTFRVRASNGVSPDAVSGPLTISIAPAVVGGTFTPLAPSRILDTRNGTGTCAGACTAVGPGQTLTLQVAGRGGVPLSGASAVVMNVTGVASATTFLTVYPSDGAQPTASNLNVDAGRTAPNLVAVKLGADGAVKVFNNSGTVQVIADVAGWYDNGTAAASRFNPITPGRVLDTRIGTGSCTGGCTVIGPGETRSLQVAGQGGVPATGASAVVMNVTATDPTAESYLTVFPSDASRPLASNLNFRPGQTVPNLVVVKLGADGKVKITNNVGSVQVIADVAGWYGAPGAISGTRYTPVAPARILDTRTAAGSCTGGCRPVGPGQTLTLQVAGQGGVPAVGATAVVMNMTATEPTAEGYATVWPSDLEQPTASNLNFVPGGTVPNLVTVKLGADGTVKIFNSSGTTSYIADVAGWFNNGG